MKRKIKTMLMILLCVNVVGCSKTTDNVQEESSSTQYLIDTSLDNKEHTFKIEDTRPIIGAFTEIDQSMSPEKVKEIFMSCGNFTVSDIYTIEPSEYEMFDISVVNNEDEEVMVTFKDGRVHSKKYRKDVFDDSNKNLVFVNYESALFKQEYSSGIYADVVDENIAENLNVWEIEEELFKLFN